jgi:KaiC/GvpD/RAD55 family RecA-like ATPase
VNPTGIPGVDELIGGLPRGELVIVAGGPGTGKTMFSAGFLYWGAVKYGEKGLYVSLAEDHDTFIRNMKRVGYDFRELEDRGLFRFIDALTVMETGIAELLETIIGEASSFGAQRLVIDSLSALAQGMREPRELRVFLHTLLSRIMRGLGCTTILIEEVPVGETRIGYGFEEFVASAVIVLESPRTPDPIPDPPSKYSSGLKDLDEALGGYPKGSTILLEIDAMVTRDQYRALIWPHSANFLRNKRPIITVPGIGSSPKDLEAFYESYALPEDERKLARHFLAVEAVNRHSPANIIAYDPKDGAGSLIEKIESTAEELMKTVGSPPLIVISMDSLEFNYELEDVLKMVSRIAAWTRRNNALSLLADKSSYPELTRKISSIASIHLKLTRRHGCLLLYGIKPMIHLHAVKIETGKGYYETRLIPIT